MGDHSRVERGCCSYKNKNNGNIENRTWQNVSGPFLFFCTVQSTVQRIVSNSQQNTYVVMQCPLQPLTYFWTACNIMTSLSLDNWGASDQDSWAGFDSNLPSEWESWLRHRRPEPPTELEIIQVGGIRFKKDILSWYLTFLLLFEWFGSKLYFSHESCESVGWLCCCPYIF